MKLHLAYICRQQVAEAAAGRLLNSDMLVLLAASIPA